MGNPTYIKKECENCGATVRKQVTGTFAATTGTTLCLDCKAKGVDFTDV